MPEDEYQLILQAGFARNRAPWEESESEKDELEERPLYDQLVRRRFRDQAFRRHVREAYGNTCAVTGLCLLNGGGRPEVQAAHIRPVEHDGPDSVRNGLALTGTVHWLFDRGLISLDDDYRLMAGEKDLPPSAESLIVPGQQISLPDTPEALLHPAFLRWHRKNVYHG